MEHPIMFLTLLLDKLSAFLDAQGITHGGLAHFAHENPHVIYSWFVVLLLIVLGRLATRRLSMVPGKMQNVFECIIEGLENFQYGIMGEDGKKFFPLVATLMLYVLTCNWQGLIPGSFAPTSNLNTTAGLAVIIFVITHYVGIRVHGLGYIKHFLGPLPLLAPLMLIIEGISHLSRLLSLSLRLFGNVMGEELVVTILFILVGQFFLPLPMMALGLLTGFLQAFIISLLAMIYISGSLEHAH